MPIDYCAVAIATSLLRLDVDIIQNHRARKRPRIAERIECRSYEVPFGATPPNNQGHNVRYYRETDSFGEPKDRRHVDYDKGEFRFQVIDELAKSAKILARPRRVERNARNKGGAGLLFDCNNIICRAPTLQKITQAELKVCAEETRDTGST